MEYLLYALAYIIGAPLLGLVIFFILMLAYSLMDWLMSNEKKWERDYGKTRSYIFLLYSLGTGFLLLLYLDK